MRDYHPTPYRPDGGFRIAGLPVLLAVILLAGVGLGWLASFIGQWFYLVFLFPFGVGLCLAFACAMAQRFAHLRNRAIAGAAGLFAGVVSMTAMHYFDYLRFLDVPEVKAAVTLMPEHRPGFLDFMNIQARAGVTIGKRGSGFNLGFVGTWIYWSLETLLVAGFCFFVLIASASDPYCPDCRAWKEYRPLGTLRGREEKVAAALRKGALDRLPVRPGDPENGDLLLSASVCPVGGADCPVEIRLEEVTFDNENSESKREVVLLTYPGEALEDFEAVFASAAVEEQAEEVEEVEEVEERPRRRRADEEGRRPRRRADDEY